MAVVAEIRISLVILSIAVKDTHSLVFFLG